MNFEKDYWFSRGVIAAACALLALMVTSSNYPDIDSRDLLIIGVLYAVGLYGLIPPHLANWVFGLVIVVLLCTLVIMFPVHAIALFLVGGALYAIIGTMVS